MCRWLSVNGRKLPSELSLTSLLCSHALAAGIDGTMKRKLTYTTAYARAQYIYIYTHMYTNMCVCVNTCMHTYIHT